MGKHSINTDFPKIPGYEIIKKIGEGGMAAVYLALQSALQRMVAVKVLVPDVFGGEKKARRFLKEAQTLSHLNHPNIVSIYEIGFQDYCYFIVMEYIPQSLKEVIRKEGKLDPHQAIFITLKIADALFYVHRLGIIHRDIKPENIMFRTDSSPVLLDFGIAKAINSRTNLTRSGFFVGTPNYMSPEQCLTRKIGTASDIYSLGVVLFEMLSGKVPYPARDPEKVIIKHLREPIPLLPEELSGYQILINRMMEKNPKLRLNSLDELNSIIKNCSKRKFRFAFGEKQGFLASKKKPAEFQKTKTSLVKNTSGVEKSRAKLVNIHRTRRNRPSKLKKFFRLVLLIILIQIIVYLFSGWSFFDLPEIFHSLWKGIKNAFSSFLDRLLR